ncbi:hypothetical protein [Vibrio cholerae]|uniref:hypothetical protein n=1 Tax=Vibrio cholerae TaxID=666 RepID=UPI0030803B50
MTNLTPIREQATRYLSVKGNYPSDQGEVKYVSWSSWKSAHPCELTTWVIQEVFDCGNLLTSFNQRREQDGWNKVVYVQRDVIYNFIRDRVNLSEKEVDRLLFDHGIKLVNSQHGDPAAKWIASVRFGKVLDHYAVCGADEQKDRIMSKLQILVKETGHKWEDFIS